MVEYFCPNGEPCLGARGKCKAAIAADSISESARVLGSPYPEIVAVEQHKRRRASDCEQQKTNSFPQTRP